MPPLALVVPVDVITDADDAFSIDHLLSVIRRYIVCTDEQRLVIALWIVHTHCWEHFEFSPYLAATSPEKQCGKSRLLGLVKLLVPRPMDFIMPSEAVVFRSIEKYGPTLLLDEVDAIFSPKTADRYEGLRAILNGGFQRGATVPRCVGVGTKMDVKQFNVYCPKMLAGIGTLPDTVADRSIPIRLQRKSANEHVEQFRVREAEYVTVPVHHALHNWATDNAGAVSEARPELPDELSDRQQDCCEPLIAIADALSCGAEARTALVALLTAERQDSTESMNLRMLRDVQTVFEEHGKPRSMSTGNLIAYLLALNESDWESYGYGRGLSSFALGKLLGTFGVKSASVRDGEQVARGYRWDDLTDAWNRYLT